MNCCHEQDAEKHFNGELRHEENGNPSRVFILDSEPSEKVICDIAFFKSIEEIDPLEVGLETVTR